MDIPVYRNMNEWIYVLTFLCLTLAGNEGNTFCCEKLFLSAGEILASKQGPLLGLYSLSGHNGEGPYYSKDIFNTRVFLYLKNNTQGWSVGSDVNGSALYFTTRNVSRRGCPIGITGGYDRDIEYDPTFSIECHKEYFENNCCLSLWVNSSQDGQVWKHQGAYLGKYDLIGAYNGYPQYYKHEHGMEAFLYYKKQGNLRTDGWILNPKVGSNYVSITTRSKNNCPEGIQTAYDRDKFEDSSFSISCNTDIIIHGTPSTSTHTTSTESLTRFSTSTESPRLDTSNEASQPSWVLISLGLSLLGILIQ